MWTKVEAHFFDSCASRFTKDMGEKRSCGSRKGELHETHERTQVAWESSRHCREKLRKYRKTSRSGGKLVTCLCMLVESDAMSILDYIVAQALLARCYVSH